MHFIFMRVLRGFITTYRIMDIYIIIKLVEVLFARKEIWLDYDTEKVVNKNDVQFGTYKE